MNTATLPPVALRLSADRKDILAFGSEDKTDDEENYFYHIPAKELATSHGRQGWIDHLSRKSWFGPEQLAQFTAIIDTL